MHTKIKGLIAAPFTPMDMKGNLNLEMIAPYACLLIDNHITGAFICGTTGEGASLTMSERKEVLEAWVRHADGKLKIITHVGGNCLNDCIELARHSEENGAYGIAAYSPSFYKPGNAKELVSFLAPIAAAAPHLPFFFYNIPSLTGVNIPVSEILPYAESMIPNFAGIKFTHFDLYDMQKAMNYKGKKFQILHGYDETFICGLSLGIDSAVGSTYNYIPGIYLKIWESFNNCDMAEARKYQQYSVKVVNILLKYGGGVRAGKAIMSLSGIECGPCRQPFQKMTKDEIASLKTDLDEINFFNNLNDKPLIKKGAPQL